jgi:hypothetical protein
MDPDLIGIVVFVVVFAVIFGAIRISVRAARVAQENWRIYLANLEQQLIAYEKLSKPQQSPQQGNLAQMLSDMNQRFQGLNPTQQRGHELYVAQLNRMGARAGVHIRR